MSLVTIVVLAFGIAFFTSMSWLGLKLRRSRKMPNPYQYAAALLIAYFSFCAVLIVVGLYYLFAWASKF